MIAASSFSSVLFTVAQVAFVLSGGLALISAGLKLFADSKSRPGFWLALAGAIFGLVQFVLAVLVQTVQATDPAPKMVGGPPLWLMLLVPALPLIINAALVLAHRRNMTATTV